MSPCLLVVGHLDALVISERVAVGRGRLGERIVVGRGRGLEVAADLRGVGTSTYTDLRGVGTSDEHVHTDRARYVPWL